jgi:hypothetical protein
LIISNTGNDLLYFAWAVPFPVLYSSWFIFTCSYKIYSPGASFDIMRIIQYIIIADMRNDYRSMPTDNQKIVLWVIVGYRIQNSQ